MKWKDIQKYRNVYFAHNFRDLKADNKFVLFDDYVNLQNTTADDYSTKEIIERFQLNQLLLYISPFIISVTQLLILKASGYE
jgi:hypothetical protein